ncbi:hypothetical protein BDC45DRAFT_609096 [Circinella umbellata]|nr:hypothetical protein BDC45DRAFT_609096 [Circinella umbellata]
MGLSRQNSQSTLWHQASSSSMTSFVMDTTDTITEEQSPSLPPSYISSTPTPTPSTSSLYQQQMPPSQPQPQPTFSVSFMPPLDPTSPPPQQITRARKRLASLSSSQPPRNRHPRNNNQ